MSSIDIRNLALPQISVSTGTGVATSTPSTVVGTPTPTPALRNPFIEGYTAASTSVTLPNGTSLNLPSLDYSQVSTATALFGNMSSADLEKVHKASHHLASALFAAVASQSSSSTDAPAGIGVGAFNVGTVGTNAVASASDTAQTGSGQSNSDQSSAGSGTLAATTDNTSQVVSDLNASMYQTLMQTAVSFPSEDGEDDSDSDDDNSWAVSSSIPQLQNLNSNMQLQELSTTQVAASTSVVPTATSSAGITMQNKLYSGSSSLQAPEVSSVTPAVASAAVNAATVYASASASTASAGSSGSLNYDGAVNAVTYMGIIGLQNQLTSYAQETQNQLNELNEARTEYEDVGTALSNWPASASTQQFTWTTWDANGNPSTSTADLTYDQATTLKANLEQQVNGMSDTNQTQQLQLQSLTQSYSQAIQTMSNLLKMNFDTIKSIINNIHT